MTDLPVVDIRTIIFLLLLGNLINVGMIAFYTGSPAPLRPYRMFQSGKLLQALAWLLLGLRGLIPDLLSIYGGNSILFAGFGLEITAVLTAPKPSPGRERMFAIITLLCILGFCGLADRANLYVAYASLGTVIFFGLAAFFLLREATSTLQRAIGGLYAFFALVLVFRALLAFVDANLTLFSANLVQSAAFLSMYLLLLVGSSGFLLLLREQADVELLRANHELERISHIDSLTGLANRRTFNETLTRATRESRRHGRPMALIMIDIDFFKDFNDLYGHAFGDQALALVGGQLKNFSRRAGDLAARYGGEEFALILPDNDLQAASEVAESIRMAVYNLNLPHAGSIVAGRLTISLGVFSATPGPEDTNNDIWFIVEADRRLYKAKQAGRNRTVCE